ncbi:MAG: NAD(P)/FAD-dependent oxidoreductase, partial [Alphaproteobacteria bacterium]|nr:NAD(P)/FAD-dependent oxidoreductase [Alphaproteobacteria bacterium]
MIGQPGRRLRRGGWRNFPSICSRWAKGSKCRRVPGRSCGGQPAKKTPKGQNVTKTAVYTDVVVIGAGPVGLFAIFELGLLDLSCHVIDILDRPGGQCAELYPEKPIYDIPGFVEISGQELTDNLIRQVAPFGARYHYNRMVAELEHLPEGGFRLVTDEGEEFFCKVVVIAAGGGSFQPKRPPIAGIEAYEGQSVHYSVRRMEEYSGHDLVIVGGGDSAVDWTLSLAGVARSLTLVHRRENFRAAPASVNSMKELVAAGTIDFSVGQITGLEGADGLLEGVAIKTADGQITVPATRMLPFFGLTM